MSIENHHSNTIIVDRKIAIRILDAYASDHGTNRSEMSRKMGYNSNYLSNCAFRGCFTVPAAKSLNYYFNIDVNDMLPVPEPEPEPIPEPIPEPETDAQEEVTETKPDYDAQTKKLFEDLANLVENQNRIINLLADLHEVITKLPKPISEEGISCAVEHGMSEYMKGHKKELTELLTKNVKGAIFAGNFEALKKHDEIQMDFLNTSK